MELFVFVRFHVRAGEEEAAVEAVRDVVEASRREPGCLRMHAYRATGDPRLFYVHSIWSGEAAFDTHAGLPHTVRFLERMESLTDEPLDVVRTRTVV